MEKSIIVGQEENQIIEQQSTSAESLIAIAIKQGASIDTLERMMTMRRELKAEKAKELFDQSMSEFQGECPTIQKKKKGGTTNSGQVAYYYAPLESIVEQTKELIKKHGFSYLIKTETQEKKVKATCIVKHSFGHSESSEIELPLGTKTNVMNDSQVMAAATTFAKRYAFCNAFGIMTGDQDTDSVVKNKQQEDNKNEKEEKGIWEETSRIIKAMNEMGFKTESQKFSGIKRLTGISLKSWSMTQKQAKDVLMAVLSKKNSKK